MFLSNMQSHNITQTYKPSVYTTDRRIMLPPMKRPRYDISKDVFTIVHDTFSSRDRMVYESRGYNDNF